MEILAELTEIAAARLEKALGDRAGTLDLQFDRGQAVGKFSGGQDPGLRTASSAAAEPAKTEPAAPGRLFEGNFSFLNESLQ